MPTDQEKAQAANRLAQLCIGREDATLKTIKKRIKELDDVANWEVPQ